MLFLMFECFEGVYLFAVQKSDWSEHHFPASCHGCIKRPGYCFEGETLFIPMGVAQWCIKPKWLYYYVKITPGIIGTTVTPIGQTHERLLVAELYQVTSNFC